MSFCEKGSVSIGPGMIVTLLVAAIMIAISAEYFNEFMNDASMSRARAGANKIASTALIEYSSASPGSDGIRLNVDIPVTVKKIVFGPLSQNRERNIYFIEFADGSNESYITEVKFASYDTVSGKYADEPFILYPGRHVITIKIEMVDGMPMAILHGDKP
jgi:hypothetical protein